MRWLEGSEILFQSVLYNVGCIHSVLFVIVLQFVGQLRWEIKNYLQSAPISGGAAQQSY